MTKYIKPPVINWTAIGGICGIIICLVTVAGFGYQFIMPEIKARQKISDDVNSLKVTATSVAGELKEHGTEIYATHQDVIKIMDALHIQHYDYPATVTGTPVKPLASSVLTPYQLNIVTHNTRAENQAKREAAGLPPAPSKAERLISDKELSGEGPAALADNLTAQ